MKKLAAAFLLVLFCVCAHAKGPKVGEVFCDFDAQHLYVTFDLQPGFLTQDVVDALNSTNPSTFTYEVELAKKRLLWFDKTAQKAVVTKTVLYDNLTRQYELTVAVNKEQTEKKSLTSIEEVEKELSEVRGLDLGSVADLTPGENIYCVRIRVTLLKGFFLWLFPADVDTGWQEKDLKTP